MYLSYTVFVYISDTRNKEWIQWDSDFDFDVEFAEREMGILNEYVCASVGIWTKLPLHEGLK